MTATSRTLHADQAQDARPTPQDPVLTALRDAEARYREMYLFLERQTAETRQELARAREDSMGMSQQLAVQRRELDELRSRVQHEYKTAETLAAALGEIHRSLFSGNIYDLVLKTCLMLTGATRGLYVTVNGQLEHLRVRAAVDVADSPSSPPSGFIAGLCRTALQTERVSTCNELSPALEAPGNHEAFRNCVVAPVILRSNLSGVVIVADKASGDFDEHDADVLLSVGSHAAVAIENTRLQHEIQEAYLSIVTVLAETMAARNQQARQYQESGCRYARVVAERLGLSEHERSVVYYAALLHDIGNIGVSDGVLNKPGPLLDAERELIHAHAQIGHDLLREIPVLEAVAAIVRHHHERYDGSGYPDGLTGDAIPIAARIVAVVDAYGAMLAPRSYRPALSHAQACEELRQGAGTQFDPGVVDTFLAVVEDGQTQLLGIDDEAPEVWLPGLDVRGGTPPDLVPS